jgi:hypothetical protein
MSQITTSTTSSVPNGPGKVTFMNGTTHSFNSNVSTTLERIPVIDAARIWSENFDDRKAVTEDIRKASREIGFFYLVNHVRAG